MIKQIPHPVPYPITFTELAKYAGLSRQRVHQLAKDGVIPWRVRAGCKNMKEVSAEDATEFLAARAERLRLEAERVRAEAERLGGVVGE